MNKQQFIIAGLLVFCLVSATFAQDVQEDENVLVLTQDNFQSVIDKYQYVLVKFYAPWCGHCKSMAPAYSQAAAQFKNTDNVRIAKVDCTIHKDLASKFGIQGYPTLKFFTNGKDQEFNGGRDSQQIVNWINKKTQPPTRPVNTVEELDKLIADTKVLAVFFGEEGSKEFQFFESLARLYDDVVFVNVNDQAVKAHYAPKSLLTVFKQFDERRADFEGNFELSTLQTFVNANKIPLVSEFTQDIAQAVFADNRAALFLFVGEDERSQFAQQQLEAAAKQLKGQIIFSWAQVREGFGKRLGDYIGITESQVPTVRIVQNKDDAPQKFELRGDITEESLRNFVQDFLEGKLAAVFKSEEIPTDNNGPVTVVVGKNFESVVLDPTKDVLVEFYAPWCGHCKKLTPIWDELGEKMKAHPSVVIAKCDSTANEIQGLGVKSFPTIRYFPANNKALPGQDYTGARELQDFVKFLEENKTVQWEAQQDQQDRTDL